MQFIECYELVLFDIALYFNDGASKYFGENMRVALSAEDHKTTQKYKTSLNAIITLENIIKNQLPQEDNQLSQSLLQSSFLAIGDTPKEHKTLYELLYDKCLLTDAQFEYIQSDEEKHQEEMNEIISKIQQMDMDNDDPYKAYQEYCAKNSDDVLGIDNSIQYGIQLLKDHEDLLNAISSFFLQITYTVFTDEDTLTRKNKLIEKNKHTITTIFQFINICININNTIRQQIETYNTTHNMTYIIQNRDDSECLRCSRYIFAEISCEAQKIIIILNNNMKLVQLSDEFEVLEDNVLDDQDFREIEKKMREINTAISDTSNTKENMINYLHQGYSIIKQIDEFYNMIVGKNDLNLKTIHSRARNFRMLIYHYKNCFNQTIHAIYKNLNTCNYYKISKQDQEILLKSYNIIASICALEEKLNKEILNQGAEENTTWDMHETSGKPITILINTKQELNELLHKYSTLSETKTDNLSTLPDNNVNRTNSAYDKSSPERSGHSNSDDESSESSSERYKLRHSDDESSESSSEEDLNTSADKGQKRNQSTPTNNKKLVSIEDANTKLEQKQQELDAANKAKDQQIVRLNKQIANLTIDKDKIQKTRNK